MSDSVRVLVCGGRDYGNATVVEQELDELGLAYVRDEITIVHGAAKGADAIADKIAREKRFAVERHPADWRKHGKAAGPIRNKQMLDTGIDLVIAFPGGRGTEHMKRIAREAGVEVYEVSQ